MTCTSCGTELRDDARFCDRCGHALRAIPAREPRGYTPKHLAEKILTSRSAIEGERKQVKPKGRGWAVRAGADVVLRKR
jgi:uncharacterized membrane protein YvbJ